MLDPLILSLLNALASGQGMSEDIYVKIRSLLSTILNLDSFDFPIANLQTMLLFLQDFDLPPSEKRLVEEVRYRLIRCALGQHWQHGMVVQNFISRDMAKNLEVLQEQVEVYEDGFVVRSPKYAVQRGYEKKGHFLNDYGKLALDSCRPQ